MDRGDEPMALANSRDLRDLVDRVFSQLENLWPHRTGILAVRRRDDAGHDVPEWIQGLDVHGLHPPALLRRASVWARQVVERRAVGKNHGDDGGLRVRGSSDFGFRRAY